MADGKALLTDELLQKVEETARAQNREPEEVVAEAVSKYLEDQSWVQFVERNEARAQANGLGEGDVDRLIGEVRRENTGVNCCGSPSIQTSSSPGLTSGAETRSKFWNWRARAK